MKTTKNNFWRIILLGLALAGSLASAAFGMNQDGVSAPDATAPARMVVRVAEPLTTLISSQGDTYQIPLFALSLPFSQGKPLSINLYNMYKDLSEESNDTPCVLGNPDTIKGTALTQAFALFAHLYQTKIDGVNVEDEATYLQLLDRESNALCNHLPIQDKRTLLLDLYTAADYLDSKALYDLCERQFLSPEILQDFLTNPQEYTNQWLLAVRQIPATILVDSAYHLKQTSYYYGDSPSSLAISNDNKTMVIGYNNTIVILGDLDKPPVQILEGHTSHISSVAISSDGKTIVSGSKDAIKVWTLQDGRFTFAQTLDESRDSYDIQVAISNDCKTIVSGPDSGYDTTIKVWSLQDGSFTLAHIIKLDYAQPASSVFISNDRTTVISVSPYSMHTWDLRDGCFKKRNMPVCFYGPVISSDGHTLIGHSLNDIEVYTFSTKFTRVQKITTPVEYGDNITITTISNDGNTMVSASESNKICVFQKDLRMSNVSVLQAMLLEAIKQIPDQILDLREDTDAHKILRDIAANFNGTPAETYIHNHVIMPLPAATAVKRSAAAPTDAKILKRME